MAIVREKEHAWEQELVALKGMDYSWQRLEQLARDDRGEFARQFPVVGQAVRDVQASLRLQHSDLSVEV